MGDGPDSATLRLAERRSAAQKSRQKAPQYLDDGGNHGSDEKLASTVGLLKCLTRKFAAELFYQCAAVLFAAVGQVHVDHGGVDVLVT